jgi:hypothetical protein
MTTTKPGLLARLRAPKPAETVHVALTGNPAAVAAIARALASVTVVTGMRHRPTTEARVLVEVTCHPAGPVRGGESR